MNLFKLIPRLIIKKSFNISVWVIEQFHDLSPYNKQAETLKQMPEGTLGNDIAKCLADNKLRLVPNFESHDLKHVLLDFKMTPVDEIRMQAFMLWNGNYTLPCFIILLFGVLLLPAKWMILYNDFRRGRNTAPISTWTIDAYANCKTADLRNLIFEQALTRKTMMTLQNLTKYGALASILAGIAGMIFCLPFLFSSSLADLFGAGFPFVGGAILIVGGLMALSNLARLQAPKIYAWQSKYNKCVK